MIIKQISIFVENKPGRLAEITKIIAKNNINIRALSVADTTHFGILRIIVDDPEQVERILKEEGLTVSITSVITACIHNRPGGLAEVLELLASNEIAIEYMYAFITVSKQFAYVVFRVADNDSATALLEANGVKMVTEEDIKNL